ncbi:MAG TPA: DUF4242 domain-containing protein [Rhodocyclaceae bacterium]|nr:DUF4242 domain-containing protein [Rhodocyclaceae bacterium]
MEDMRYFIDTHDANHGTYPAGLTPEQFEGFFIEYESACKAEGVIIVRVHVGYEHNRAFCLTMAKDAAAVERAHRRAGLPFDSITEIKTATPADTFLRRSSIGGAAVAQ